MTISGREHALRIVAAIVLATVLAAGCIGMQPSSTATASGDGLSSDIPQPGLERLRGPWQAEPFALEPAIAAAAEMECRRDGVRDPGIARELRLRVSDARGGGRMTLLFAGDGAGYATCELEVLADGGFMRGGGSTAPDDGTVPPVPRDRVSVRGSSGSSGAGVASTDVDGQVGALVAQVRIRTVRLETVASVGDGWFIAWWPSFDHGGVIEAYAADGAKLGEQRW